ncbi:MAG: response regulator transcription factor [Bradyrhizobiaceae bacterium]|nr:response regulator transcription factor [Bradyrhizobiaceae bacterium]
MRVAIVEDHADELQGFLEELQRADDVDVVATARTADEARQKFSAAQPDIIVVDLVLPDGTGAGLITELRVLMPSVHYVVLSAYEDYDRIYSAILAGAVGYLGKTYVGDGLVAALRDVHAGGSPISSPIARKVLQAFQASVRPQLPISTLTIREQEILHILASGRSYKDIANALCISTETVRTHVRNIYQKLQVDSWRKINQSDLYNNTSS